MRPTPDQYFLRMAALAATRGTCLRRQVGCVLVDTRGHVLATGYNGVASGMPHCNEEVSLPEQGGWTKYESDVQGDWCIHCHRPRLDHDERARCWPYTKTAELTHPHACPGARAPSGTEFDACGAIHAEMNALLQCADPFKIFACYVTDSPCLHPCVKMLMNTSCRRIVFTKPYAHDKPARKLWTTRGPLLPRTWEQVAC